MEAVQVLAGALKWEALTIVTVTHTLQLNSVMHATSELSLKILHKL